MCNILLPQKVLSLEKELAKKNPKLSGEYMLTIKQDGWWVSIRYDKTKDTWGSPISSSGREIPSLVWSIELFNKLPKPKTDCILIAEAIIPDTPFYIINGKLNKSVGSVDCRDVEFRVHDLLLGNIVVSAKERYTLLIQLADKVPNIVIEKLLLVAPYNAKVWQHLFETTITQGFEGIVAKKADSTYQQGKRNSDLLKLKLECTVDCLAVRLEEGVGEKGNPSLTLVSQRANGTEIRTVISKHSDQALFRSNPDSIIGKVIQIKAMEQYEDLQLRQPVFQYIREDKLTSEID